MATFFTVHRISSPPGESFRPNGDKNAQRSSAPHFSVRRSAFGVQRFFPRSRTAFTVIELMIVAGVISILLSILLPVFHNARKAAMRSRARIEATALAQAAVQYKNVYGYWPGMVREAGENSVQANPFSPDNRPSNYTDWPLVSRFGNDTFKVSIRAQDGSTSEANYINDNLLYRSLLPFNTKYTDNLNPLNPRRFRFLEMKNEAQPDLVNLPDPWTNQYVVVMGLLPSTQYTFVNNGQTILIASNLTAFAFSWGTQGNSGTNLIFSAGVPQ